jgi:hypothetical protein
MTTSSLLLSFTILFSLITKHFICDFLLQDEKQLSEKGNMLKSGGYIHAGIHASMTFVVLFSLFREFYMMALCAATIDFVLHYLIDWSKVQISQKYSVTPKDKLFWYLFGLDQYLHLMTYFGLAAIFAF